MIKAIISKITQSFGEAPAEPKTKSLSLVATALLLEVIKADHQLTDVEFSALRKHCARAFALNVHETEALVQDAIKISNEATSIWEHTDIINEHMNSEAKYELILNMWKIAYADNKLDSYEEHLIRRVSDLIYIPHTLFIKAKHEAFKLVGLEN